MSSPSEFETGSKMPKLGGDGELLKTSTNTAECPSLREHVYKEKMLFRIATRQRPTAETAEGLIR